MNFKFFLLFLFIPFMFSCTENTGKVMPKAKEGVIDLRNWDFQNEGIVNLSGKWGFYWEQLLNPQDFEKSSPQAEYIFVPQGWGVGKNGSKKYPEFGYATYHLKIILPQDKKEYRLLFNRLYSATKVYLNGELLTEGGIVATNKKGYFNQRLDFDDYFNKKNYSSETEMDLIIQVSDFDSNAGFAGLRSNVLLGTKKQIQARDNTVVTFGFIIIGMLMMIGIYHLILFFYHKKDYSTLVFTLLAFAVIFRVGFERGLINRFFAVMPYKLYIQALSGELHIDTALIALFFYMMFNKYFNKTLLKIILFIASIGLLSTLFLSANQMNDALVFTLGFLFLVMIFLIVVTFRAMISGEEGGLWAFIGLIGLFSANIYDVFVALGVIGGPQISSYGFIIMILFQSIIIAERFSLSFKSNIRLNKTLDNQNKNLERIVSKRTSKIEEQKEEIVTRNEELYVQQEEIMAVNESLEEQRVELQKKNTAVTDSIRYARTIQKAILPSQSYRSRLFPKSFVIYRAKDIVSGDFFWIKEYKNKCFIACVDCTGHGVPGAFMSMIGNNLLNEAIDHKQYLKPSEILDYLNENIRIRLNQEEGANSDGMDISICRFEKIDNEKTKILYAGAKNSIYIVKNNERLLLKGDRKSIGGIHFKLGFLFQNFEEELTEGDMVYLKTDGYIDQIDEERQRFGSLRFRELINSSYKKTIGEQEIIFNRELDTHQGTAKQRDDITVIGVRI